MFTGNARGWQRIVANGQDSLLQMRVWPQRDDIRETAGESEGVLMKRPNGGGKDIIRLLHKRNFERNLKLLRAVSKSFRFFYV